MKHYHYSGAQDFFRAQAALMQWVSEAGHCNYWHKGDIGHCLFNDCYNYDPAQMFHYWHDTVGEIVAFAILVPHQQTFILQVAPKLLNSNAHRSAFEFCERETLRIAAAIDKPIDVMVVETDACDPNYIDFIKARGYTQDKLILTLTKHDLNDLPTADLPPGFYIRQATAADAAKLADVHNHSFTNKWNAESYAAVFKSPHMEYEFVVVAPDGRFAAFTNVWIDEVNRSLLFEPVGTHSEFRRRGIAKALMLHLLRLMPGERGIECAYVCHEPPDKNLASTALYASVGFKKLHDIYEFSRQL